MSLFKPTPEQFAGQVIQQLATRGIQATYDQQSNTIALSTGLRLSLANFYRDFCGAPIWKRRAVVDHYLTVADPATHDADPQTPDEFRASLMPKVRERAYTEFLRLRARLEERSEVPLQQRIFADGHLTLEVVIDTPKFTKSVRPESLVEWGLTFDDALAIASENLKQRSGNGGFAVVQPGLYVSTWRDTFDASRLALSDFVTQLGVKGRIVAMVPNRDVLIVTGEGDSDGLVKMSSMCEKVLKDPRPMTGLAFRLDAGWVPFLPSEDHPSYRLLKTLQVQSLGEIYAEQKAVLDEQNEKQNIDIFVASFGAYRDPAGSPTSWTSWAESVDTLLPHTDVIAFGARRENGEREMAGQARWDDVMRVVPELMTPQGTYPERFRTTGFPTKAQFDAMRLISFGEATA